MDAHVQLNVPPDAVTARLLTRNRRWGVYYRALVGETEGHVEFRMIDPDMFRADEVDPADSDAVIAHIERRLHGAGFDTVRRPPEDAPVTAAWDLHRRGAA